MRTDVFRDFTVPILARAKPGTYEKRQGSDKKQLLFRLAHTNYLGSA